MGDRIITPELKRDAYVGMRVVEAIQALTRASCFSTPAHYAIEIHCSNERAARGVSDLLTEGISRQFHGDGSSSHLITTNGCVLRIEATHQPEVRA